MSNEQCNQAERDTITISLVTATLRPPRLCASA